MKTIIVRHGETEENKKGILQGNIPGTLSDQGLVDAQKTANLIISSDLKRASDTAKIVARYHPDTEFILTPGKHHGCRTWFHEQGIDCGPFEKRC